MVTTVANSKVTGSIVPALKKTKGTLVTERGPAGRLGTPGLGTPDLGIPGLGTLS